jgi:hypothetical protein
MTLNLDWQDVRDYENVCEMDDPERPGHRTSTPLVFVMGVLMMHTGISHLTEDNADEFFVRTRLIESCFGGGLMTDGKGKSVGITPADVHAHIGLKSNVSRYTTAQFYKHLREDVVRELRQQYRYATKDLAAPVS